jgi:hypothetical protein
MDEILIAVNSILIGPKSNARKMSSAPNSSVSRDSLVIKRDLCMYLQISLASHVNDGTQGSEGIGGSHTRQRIGISIERTGQSR